MKVSVPAGVAIGLALVFSAYHLVLATSSLALLYDIAPVIACMVLYAAATAVVLFQRATVLPMWAACFALATAIVMPVVITPQIRPVAPGAGYTSWYIAAIGTLMVIVSVKGRVWFAWAGIAFLVVQTIVWGGPAAIVELGVVGDLTWVAVSTVYTSAVNRATRITRDFVRAEQETADWQAAQDAHVFERQFRVQQTTRMARPMLERIIASGGDLTPEERAECLNLEGAIRDEIRGRSLLSDDVRREVMALRRGGTTVTLLDEGGLDDVGLVDRRRIHDRLAAALAGAQEADTVIVRTVPEGAETAVTVVGLRLDGAATQSNALGAVDEDDEDDDSVALWLEIPRHLHSAV